MALMKEGRFYFSNINTLRNGMVIYYALFSIPSIFTLLSTPIVRPYIDYYSILNILFEDMPLYINIMIWILSGIVSFILIEKYNNFLFNGYILFNKDIYYFNRDKLIRVLKVRDVNRIEFSQLSQINYNRAYKERLNNKFVIITRNDERFEFSLYLKSKIEDFRLERAMTKINEKL